jgi:oligoribonuclease
MRLLWLDMEMTGLDVNKERIIEVACIASAKDWLELDTYHAVVYQDASFISGMDEWNRKQHGGTGLTKLIANGKPQEDVEKEIIGFINKHWDKKERPILAGNSIHQDRKFIEKYMPDLDQRLHYRMLDVSAFKIIFDGLHNLKYKKRESHRALDDIRESLNELKYYLQFIKPPQA